MLDFTLVIVLICKKHHDQFEFEVGYNAIQVSDLGCVTLIVICLPYWDLAVLTESQIEFQFRDPFACEHNPRTRFVNKTGCTSCNQYSDLEERLPGVEIDVSGRVDHLSVADIRIRRIKELTRGVLASLQYKLAHRLGEGPEAIRSV